MTGEFREVLRRQVHVPEERFGNSCRIEATVAVGITIADCQQNVSRRHLMSIYHILGIRIDTQRDTVGDRTVPVSG